jgi:hypothetical protein
MNSELAALLRRWSLSLPDGPEFMQIESQLGYFFDELYDEYEPTRDANPDFWERLNQWLNNVPAEADKKALLRLVPLVFFLGPREMECLYRTSFRHQVLSWIVEGIASPLHDPNLSQTIEDAISKTWFCPITDSMRINAFYHYNALFGRDFRPDWRSLCQFGDVSKVEDYIASERIERLVLLEDFVGSGSQMFYAVRFAASLPSHLPVLVVPLIMSPRAETIVAVLRKRHANVTIRPVITLSRSTLITRIPSPNEMALAPEVRAIAITCEGQMMDGLSPDKLAKWYGPFGFDQSGALIIMYTNCPDNSLPMLHHDSPRWKALFPRSSRI